MHTYSRARTHTHANPHIHTHTHICTSIHTCTYCFLVASTNYHILYQKHENIHENFMLNSLMHVQIHLKSFLRFVLIHGLYLHICYCIRSVVYFYSRTRLSLLFAGWKVTPWTFSSLYTCVCLLHICISVSVRVCEREKKNVVCAREKKNSRVCVCVYA